MKKLKRLTSAFNRYKRSKGFGIHSPFAFNFVLRVLKERLPYYAYDDIRLRRTKAIDMASKISRHPGVMSLKNAKMLFRITCHFNPSSMLQIGTSYGLSATTLLDVSSLSHLYIFTGYTFDTTIYQSITSPYSNRIHSFTTIEEAVDAYTKSLNGEQPFVLINEVCDNEIDQCRTIAMDSICNEGVVIVRNLSKSDAAGRIWSDIMEQAKHGMGFSNGHIAIFVGYKHLPKQHYSLWF